MGRGAAWEHTVPADVCVSVLGPGVHAFSFPPSFQRHPPLHFLAVLGIDQSSLLITRVYFSKRLRENQGSAFLGDRACCLLLFVLVGYLRRCFSNSLVCTGGTLRTRSLLPGAACWEGLSPHPDSASRRPSCSQQTGRKVLVTGDSPCSSLVPAWSKWTVLQGEGIRVFRSLLSLWGGRALFRGG